MSIEWFSQSSFVQSNSTKFQPACLTVRLPGYLLLRLPVHLVQKLDALLATTAHQPCEIGGGTPLYYPVLLVDFFITSTSSIINSCLCFDCCRLCYVRMPQLILHHVHDNSISCFNATYLFLVFPHSEARIL